MKHLLLTLSLCFSALVWAHASTDSGEALDWLNTIDAGKYDESWQNTDAFFKAQVTKAKWSDTLKGVRTPLGQVVSRSKISSQHHTSLPGAPDGEYLVIQYQTEFQHKKASTETLTLSKSSGQWRPVGYFIR